MMRIGYSKVNITPYIGCPMGGYAARDGVSVGMHDELYARVMILEGDERFAVVTADVIGFSTDFVRQVRDRVAEELEIKPDHIMLVASHNHSGPAICHDYQGSAAPCYVQTLALDIVGGIKAAWLNREPCKVGVASGSVSGIGVNRRRPNGPVDHEVGVIKVETKDGRIKGTLFNYTCHAVVLGPDNLLITADYPGYAVQTVERAFGGALIAMFTNGAAGDINTGHSADLSALGEKVPGRTFERAEKLGRILAGEVVKVLETIETSLNVPIVIRTKEIALPLRPLPSLKEAEEFLREKERTLDELVQKGAPAEVITSAKIQKFYAEILLKLVHKRNKNLDNTFKHVELQAIRIGDCALLAFPGELFVEIGLEIKKKSPFRYTYIVGYANGDIGYVPTKQSFEEGGYEVAMTQFAPETSDIVTTGALTLLQSLA